MSGSFLQMVIGLAVVLAAIVLTAWFARRMGVGGGQSARLIKVISALQVGAKERVVVIEFDGQWMLLGVAPGRVNALATLPRGTLPDSTVSAPSLPQGFDFAALLRKARQRG